MPEDSEPSQVEIKFTVQGELGLHARPAGRFATLASRFECEISVAREDDDEWVSGRSVLSILSLAASQGTVLRLRAEGPDAEEAVGALGALLSQPQPSDLL
jgi:phosphocarrier protein